MTSMDKVFAGYAARQAVLKPATNPTARESHGPRLPAQRPHLRRLLRLGWALFPTRRPPHPSRNQPCESPAQAPLAPASSSKQILVEIVVKSGIQCLRRGDRNTPRVMEVAEAKGI
ncbi:uncharacterized protein P174DRAFT_423310 [Aspergillus novofumigatus IBT 16806]|uniref:Uncharacterized protein n=1 Tax=Aspergillus novofumigatus (strain IBT 16806) TaxID=1392255 RepID=A0A2I1C3G5_ASPN1|nr:uncharacterized protein P174DRAFT_423310 [Aspergillus novofumigatus IBT 16806]PKX92174.1 hypothetical protein P174DRAFT_423310 [Aspergillus novofumigatus IBT 16806]